VALTATRAGEDHQLHFVGNLANSGDLHGTDVVRRTVAFQQDLGATVNKDNLGGVGELRAAFHAPILPLVVYT
jgi:hypothetical protein